MREPVFVKVVEAATLGAALGVLARLWMRLLSDNPEFSWSGTITIVVAFTLFGAGAAVARLVRQRASRRRTITIGRVVAGVLSLGLFGAAGAVMLPTVVGASVAVHRTDWPRAARLVAAVVAMIVPALLLIDAAARLLEPGVALGFALLALTYVLVVAALAPVVAPLYDGHRLRRLTKVLASLAGTGASFVIGGLLVGIVSDGV